MLYSRVFKSLAIFGHHYLWILGFITFPFPAQNVSVRVCKKHFIYGLILQTISTASFPYLAFETIRRVKFFTEPVVVYISIIFFIFRTIAILIIIFVNFYIQPALCDAITDISEITSEFPTFYVDRHLLLILTAKSLNCFGQLFLQFYFNAKTMEKGKHFLIILRCLEKLIEYTVLDILPIGYILGLLLIRRIIQLMNEHLSNALHFHVTTKPAMRKISLIHIRLALDQSRKIQKDVFKVACRFHEILQVQALLSAAFSFFNMFGFCYFLYYTIAAVNRSLDEDNWDASTKTVIGIFFQFVDLLILAKVAEDTVQSYETMNDTLLRIFPMVGVDEKLDEIIEHFSIQNLLYSLELDGCGMFPFKKSMILWTISVIIPNVAILVQFDRAWK